MARQGLDVVQGNAPLDGPSIAGELGRILIGDGIGSIGSYQRLT